MQMAGSYVTSSVASQQHQRPLFNGFVSSAGSSYFCESSYDYDRLQGAGPSYLCEPSHDYDRLQGAGPSYLCESSHDYDRLQGAGPSYLCESSHDNEASDEALLDANEYEHALAYGGGCPMNGDVQQP